MKSKTTASMSKESVDKAMKELAEPIIKSDESKLIWTVAPNSTIKMNYDYNNDLEKHPPKRTNDDIITELNLTNERIDDMQKKLDSIMESLDLLLRDKVTYDEI